MVLKMAHFRKSTGPGVKWPNCNLHASNDVQSCHCRCHCKRPMNNDFHTVRIIHYHSVEMSHTEWKYQSFPWVQWIRNCKWNNNCTHVSQNNKTSWWKHLRHYWLFVSGIQRQLANFHYKSVGNGELWCFLCLARKQALEQKMKLSVIWYTITANRRHCNVAWSMYNA